jgi:vitamin B12 transport system substrate-binding protein
MRKTLSGLLYLFISATWAEGPQRIVSLAPHTTELIYSLNAEDRLLAVSDYSDYPEAAKALPRIASYQGVDFEALVKLQPELVLVWQGGNKPQDIQRIRALGYRLFVSSPQQPADIANEVEMLGEVLGKRSLARRLAQQHRQALQGISERYRQAPPLEVFYYMHPKPLMSIGGGAWANHLLELCNSTNIFANAVNDYPEVTVEEVIRRQPQAIVAAQRQDMQQVKNFWQPWLPMLRLNTENIIRVDPDRLHRFSLRLTDGAEAMCRQLHRLR